MKELRICDRASLHLSLVNGWHAEPLIGLDLICLDLIGLDLIGLDLIGFDIK